MTSSLRHLLATLAVGLVVVAGLSVPEPASASPESTYADAVFSATNHQRRIHDRKALRHQACLTRYAARWAKEMGTGLGLVHQSLRPILKNCHLSWVGENIAVGFPDGRSVVAAWMKSPMHRANILRRQYRRQGIGVYRNPITGVWWVSQVFGRPA
jgi:uncharacterized protein YkwD